MANITAAQVNELRKRTGAGMMDCKQALTEADGDAEKAIEILRKKGQKIASKRSDKEASEGIVIAKANEQENRAVVVMINCETDFVAKNEEFVGMANKIVDAALNSGLKNLEDIKKVDLGGRTVEETVTDMMGKIGEKIDISKFAYLEGAKVVAYNHLGNKLATIVELNKVADTEVARDVAMQVAAMNPVALNKDSVPQDIIEKEIEIGKEQARKEGKPENMLEKIALGKLNKFFKESTLVEQQFIKDSKKSVGEFLKSIESDLTVNNYIRLQLGE